MKAFILFLLSSKNVAWVMFIAGMILLVAWLYPAVGMSFIPGVIFLGIGLGVAVNYMEKSRLLTSGEDFLLGDNSAVKIPWVLRAVIMLMFVAVSCYVILFPYAVGLVLSPLNSEALAKMFPDTIGLELPSLEFVMFLLLNNSKTLTDEYPEVWPLFIIMPYVGIAGTLGITSFVVARGNLFADESIVAVRKTGIWIALILAIAQAGYALLLFMDNDDFIVSALVSMLGFILLATLGRRFAL